MWNIFRLEFLRLLTAAKPTWVLPPFLLVSIAALQEPVALRSLGFVLADSAFRAGGLALWLLLISLASASGDGASQDSVSRSGTSSWKVVAGEWVAVTAYGGTGFLALHLVAWAMIDPDLSGSIAITIHGACAAALVPLVRRLPIPGAMGPWLALLLALAYWATLSAWPTDSDGGTHPGGAFALPWTHLTSSPCFALAALLGAAWRGQRG